MNAWIRVAVVFALAMPGVIRADEGAPEAPDDTGHVVMLQATPTKTEKVAFLGVSSSPVPPWLCSHLALPRGVGLVVERVEPDSPAAEAGLKEHDVLHKLGDQLLINPEQFATLVRIRKPGDEVTLSVIREGKPIEVKATLIERDMPIAAPFMPRTFEFPRGHLETLRELEIPLPGIIRGRGGQNVKIVVADNEHTLTITVKDGARTLLATDKEGAVIHEGPIDTQEQIDALPEVIREKVRKINEESSTEEAEPAIRQYRFRNLAPRRGVN